MSYVDLPRFFLGALASELGHQRVNAKAIEIQALAIILGHSTLLSKYLFSKHVVNC